jgi:KUP system potassium uptake protein
MLMTSFLLFIAMSEIWQWSLWTSAAVAGLFVIVDARFFAANSLKIAEGGYVPLLLAACVYSLMLIWHAVPRNCGSRCFAVIGNDSPATPRVPLEDHWI